MSKIFDDYVDYGTLQHFLLAPGSCQLHLIHGFTLVLVRACDSGVEPAAKSHLLARPNCQQLAHWLLAVVFCVLCCMRASVHTVQCAAVCVGVFWIGRGARKKYCDFQILYPPLTLTATRGVKRRLGDGTIFVPLLAPLPILDSHTHPSQLVPLPLSTRRKSGYLGIGRVRFCALRYRQLGKGGVVSHSPFLG
jgi:hypothetical protein